MTARAIIGGIERHLGAWKPTGRKFSAPAPVLSVASLPDEVQLLTNALGMRFPTDYDQGSIGSCGPNSIAEVFEFEFGGPGGEPRARFSRLFLYYWTRATEKDVDEDSGVTIPDLIDVASAMGMPLEDLWPYDVSKMRECPPASALYEATKHRIEQNGVVADLPHLLYELAMGQPVTFGFQVPAAMQSDDVARTGVVPMPQSKDDTIGGHCVNAIGYSRPRGAVRCTSHYGSKFGDGGAIWLPFGYFAEGFASDMRAVRRVS